MLCLEVVCEFLLKLCKVFKNVLTRIVVMRILINKNDKNNCQNDNESGQHGRRGENMPLQNRLKEYRAKISVNQHEMGKLVGVSRQTISQIERGDYSPSVTLALKIAKVFQVSVEDIFEYKEDDNESGNSKN